METAEVYAKLSHAKRLQVGCVIVKDKRIISIGYNGMCFSGWDNECEDDDFVTRPEVLHAESNAIARLHVHPNLRLGQFCIVHICSLSRLCKLIHQAGIVQVFYRHKYKNNSGGGFLEKCEIEVIRI